MKFKEYIEEAKEDNFIKAVRGSDSMAQVRKYNDLAHQMVLSDKVRKKIKQEIEKKMRSLTPKKGKTK